ncbi:hypothetical protein [Hymenobacter sp. BT559]|uniref:hypothetical protein n=1 Tax=Hymenobacter sp. BT559 TaxID=2795729 RepID=UPI0018EA5B1E|nr:hypothetical protein [Hymenobacter sp. BT559]MBJ6141790.1 hypothetical protein [Hymenobacter sp. BT559]
MDTTLNLTIDTGQVLAVTLSGPAEAQVLGMIAAKRGALLAAAEVEARTYHLGTKPTPGRGYDDRLTVRLGCSRSTLMAELEVWRTSAGKRGGLRYTQGGKKYWVSEQACREWLGDNKKWDKG